MAKYKEPRIISTKAKLVIAGVIVVVAIIAITAFVAVQASTRDEQVKKDASKVLAAMQQYAGNNSGAYPATNAPNIDVFVSQYHLPSGYQYSYGNGPAIHGTMQISNTNCNGSTGISVRYNLENGGAACTGSTGL